MTVKIKVALLDDDALFNSLMANYLKSHKSLKICAIAQSGPEFYDKLEDTTMIPDILLLDLKVEGDDGVQITQHLQLYFPSIKIIVLSSHYKRSFLGFMLKAGVSAFLPKGVSPDELVSIIGLVFNKGFYFQEDQIVVIREQLSSRLPQPVFEPENILTDREIEVLKLISMQKTAKEIADILFITQRTVEGRKNAMFLKTGARNVAGLVIYAIQNNLINIQDLPVIHS